MDKNKEIFFNRAEIENAEHICCDNCFEQVVFLLKDKDHEFSMGLNTILDCLAFAIESGDLPKLPLSWVSKVYDEHSPDIAYYDKDNCRKRDTNEIFQNGSQKDSKET